MGNAHHWHDFVVNDLDNFPRDHAEIEVEYENGARAQASFQSGGGISLLNASSDTGAAEPRRWRYLIRPNGQDWCEFIENDLETHPEDRVPIEAEFENGNRARASFQRGGPLSLLDAPSEITGGTALKRWRYYKRL